MNETCLFCKIIAGKIPSDTVYRDEHVVAFRDIQPQAPVHVLVVPTTHVAHLQEPDAVSGKILEPVFRTIQKLADQFELDKGFRVVVNCGEEGGQSVAHLHFHLLGRRRMAWPPG
ncbi:MAG TPA: histidine triad nucleotide-binding protein [Candidatus Ozemobacteraceae bacterium]|nr:histidine triad nucleotide-binding protein [Candidatus Ozemobacteraceae bacterium]